MFLLLPLQSESPFSSLPILILPLIAIAVIAVGVYLIRHRGGRKRG